MAAYLIGKDPLDRECRWSELKRALRKYDRTGTGTLDIALWDIAGKLYGASLHRLLGSYRERLPAYVSTPTGTRTAGWTRRRPHRVSGSFVARCRRFVSPYASDAVLVDCFDTTGVPDTSIGYRGSASER